MEESRLTQNYYHRSRFTKDARRDVLWKTLWHGFFRHRVPKNGCVLDLGAGYGQFINNVAARRRIAIPISAVEHQIEAAGLVISDPALSGLTRKTVWKADAGGGEAKRAAAELIGFDPPVLY